MNDPLVDVVITMTGMGASVAATSPRAQPAIETVLRNLRLDAAEFPRITPGPGTLVYAAPDALGVAVDGLALTLRGLGYRVSVRILGPWFFHHACGATFPGSAWLGQPAARVELATGLRGGRVGHVEVRACACGRDVPLAEMTVVPEGPRAR